MFLAAISWVVFIVPADSGRVEVEGLVISATAKPSPFSGFREDRGGELELEISIAPKAGGRTPTYQFVGPIRIVAADNRTLSSPSRMGLGDRPHATAPDRWSVRLALDEAPPKILPAVEGALSVAPSEWKTATFSGATLKPNSVVAIEGGSAKLTVLDLDDATQDVRFRLTIKGPPAQKNPISGARVTLIDAQGKESTRTSMGGGMISGPESTEHLLQFRGGDRVKADSLRALRLEAPTPKGPMKEVRFRIPNVPVDDSKDKRRGK